MTGRLNFSPSGKYLATGTSDGNLAIISAKSLRTLFQVKQAHSIFVTDLQFTHDEKFLASVSVDNTILLTNLSSIPADSGIFHCDDGVRSTSTCYCIYLILVTIYRIYLMVY